MSTLENNRNYYQTHKEHCINYSHNYYLSHKKQCDNYSKKYFKKHFPNDRERFYGYKRKLLKKHPYIITIANVRQRCRNPNIPCYKYYGGRGIKCLLTLSDIRFLWNRDKAYKLKHASIDRIDNDGHYEIGNCRFIEMSENRKKGGKNVVHI